MHDRSILGPADVSDAQLTEMVSALRGAPAQVLDSRAEVVAYDLPAITTAGRYWVRGHARVGAETTAYSLFVKHVQSWSRSPQFEQVPEEFRAMAEAGVPWRTEPLVYRSDLAERLPDGLRMPRAAGVFDLDDRSAAVWLEQVCVGDGTTWDLDRYAHAARLLGRLSGSPQVRPLAEVGGHPFTVHDYLHGRLSVQVLPMLRSPDIGRHPLVAGAFDDELREALIRVADTAPALVDELAALPRATSHGDSCPNNLLVPADGGGFVLIDFGFWGLMPIGFDLGQLLVGDVQVGLRSAADLAERDEVVVASYVDGLRAEGCDLPQSVVRRAHALQLMVFTGLSTMPFEHLGSPITPELEELVAERAAIARYSLRLLAETDPA